MSGGTSDVGIEILKIYRETLTGYGIIVGTVIGRQPPMLLPFGTFKMA